MDYHSKSFFGKKTGIIINSPAKSVPYIFLVCIKRKDDSSWEKPSKGEGKTVKLSIEEIICILDVLKKKSTNWHGYHIFKNESTQIFIGWEDESRLILKIEIGAYIKKLQFPDTKFLLLLLDHILLEKIEFATSGTFERKESTKMAPEYNEFSEQINSKDE